MIEKKQNPGIEPKSTKVDKNTLLSEWIDSYSEYLYSWAYYKTSHRETAEDMVQETFLAACQAIDKFENKSNPKTWLTSILNNKIYDYYKKKAKSLIQNFSQASDDSDSFLEKYFDENGKWQTKSAPTTWDSDENLLDNSEFLEVLRFCIDNLPELWNFAVSLKFISNKKGSEICQDLDISQSNYWQILHRAKLQLRECIENNWYIET